VAHAVESRPEATSGTMLGRSANRRMRRNLSTTGRLVEGPDAPGQSVARSAVIRSARIVYTRALSLSLVVTLAAGPALAVDPPPARLVPGLPGGGAVDVAVVGASLTLTALGSFVIRPSSTAQVAPLDGLGHRDRDPGAALATDVILAAGGLGAVGVALAGELARGSRGWYALRAPLVLTEAAALSLGVVSMVKNLGGVCRPRAWVDATGTCDSADPEDRRSFPSGHTAPLAALSGASLGMWLLPSGPRDPWAAGLFVATTALAASNLALRVAAGAHSWVDTSAGFALGFSLGLATAALHVRRAPVTLSVAGSGLALSGVW
jgi:membrane-associated phospholipid phosphatase